MRYKVRVDVGNTLIIVVGAVIGTWLTRELSQRSAPEELIYIFVLMGIILSILINFLIIKATLQPLANLQKTVEAVYHGDLMARATRTPLGDPIITHLREALNSMLEEISSSHKRLKELSSRILSVQEEERKRGHPRQYSATVIGALVGFGRTPCPSTKEGQNL